MPNFTTSVLTNLGAAQVAAAVAKTQMVITRVQVGSGVGSGNLSSLTALVNPVMNLTPQPPQVSANNLQPGEVMILSTLDSANVVGSFNFCELGVWATSGGGAEQMVLYALNNTQDLITHATGSSRLQINLSIPIVVGVGASVSITVQAGNPVYVPPVIAGNGITVDSPTDSSGRVIQWIVSTKQITNTTTLKVFLSANNVFPNFTSITNAMSYLASFSIPSQYTVTIDVSGEVYATPNQLGIQHVNGTRIYIRGQVLPDVQFSGIGAITGSQSNWQVQLTGVTNTTNIRAGSFIQVWYAASTATLNPGLLTGFYQVASVVGSTVTIYHPMHMASWPSMAGIVPGWITPISTILYFNVTAANHGVVVYDPGIAQLSNIGIVAGVGLPNNSQLFGCFLIGNCYCSQVCVMNWANNVSSGGGFGVANNTNVSLYRCSASNNSTGLIVSTAAASGTQYCSFTHNWIMGIWTQGGVFASVTGITFILGNGFVYPPGGALTLGGGAVVVGQAAFANGQLNHGVFYIGWNGGQGVTLSGSSMIHSSTDDYVFSINNGLVSGYGGYDVVMSMLSSAVSSCIIGSRIFNVTPGVLNPQGCIMV